MTDHLVARLRQLLRTHGRFSPKNWPDFVDDAAWAQRVVLGTLVAILQNDAAMFFRLLTPTKLACAGIMLVALGSIGCSSPAMRPNVAHVGPIVGDDVAPAQSSCAGELCFPYVDARR